MNRRRADDRGTRPRIGESRSAFLQRQRDAIDDYLNSVIGLYAFAVSAAWDEASRTVRSAARWSVPRRMTSAAAPGVDQELTPDAVIQVSDDYGIVAEMKKHFPTVNGSEVFEQVRKYDADLSGWWTPRETISSHDLVLLTHLTSSVRATDELSTWEESGQSFTRPFAIVEFSYHTQGQLWFLLRRLHGALSDKSHDEALRLGKHIKGSQLTELFSRWKFTDTAPPMMHMLLLIHDYALMTMKAEQQFEEATQKTVLSVETTVREVRAMLARQFSPPQSDGRDFQLPKSSWVKESLDELVALKLAVRDSSSTATDESGNAVEDVYRISLRKPRKKDTIEFFADRMFAARPQDAASEDQPTLFSQNEGVE